MALSDIFNQPEPTPEEAKQEKLVEKSKDEALGVIDYITSNEGFRGDIFLDTAGKRTVGHGLNLDDPVTAKLVPEEVAEGKRNITREESLGATQLRTDLAIKDAQRFMGGEANFRNLSNSQKKGIIDMSFNLGLTRLNKFKKLREALFKGDKLGAKREVLDSKYARDVGGRALKNANLMLK